MGAQVITYLLSDNIDIWHHGISRESLPPWLGCSTAVILGHLLGGSSVYATQHLERTEDLDPPFFEVVGYICH